MVNAMQLIEVNRLLIGTMCQFSYFICDEKVKIRLAPVAGVLKTAWKVKTFTNAIIHFSIINRRPF